MTQDFNYEEELSKCKTMQDITGQDGLVQKIIKDAVEHVLGMEMEDFILQEKEKGSSVTRNGTAHKNIKTAYGNIGIQVPRTREAGFEPDIIKKRAVIEEGLEPQIISMYAKGMTVRDISEHMQALYGINLSAASISNITDKISGEAKDWYSRTLDSFYPVVFLDAVHFKVREEGRIITKAAYVAQCSLRRASSCASSTRYAARSNMYPIRTSGLSLQILRKYMVQRVRRLRLETWRLCRIHGKSMLLSWITGWQNGTACPLISVTGTGYAGLYTLQTQSRASTGS